MKDNNNSEDFIKAISDKRRYQILKYLREACCVTDIWQKLDISQNLASFHLKVLKDLGYVSAQKKGLKVIYCVNKDKIKESLNSLEKDLF